MFDAREHISRVESEPVLLFPINLFAVVDDLSEESLTSSIPGSGCSCLMEKVLQHRSQSSFNLE